MRNVVYPIKDSIVLKQVQDTLLHNFKFGRRNFTIFQVGKATLLRVSDVLKLKYSDVFDDKGNIKHDAYTRDKKTGKTNILYLKPVRNELLEYRDWLLKNDIHSKWLFPSSRNDKHITELNLSDEVKEHIKSVTLVNPSFDESPKDNVIISFLDSTPLNIKDILKITKASVLDDNSHIKDYLHVKSSNTNKYEDISIIELKDKIKAYVDWMDGRGVKSKWLFPDEQDKHIDEDNFYLVMQRVGDLIGINYLGTHTMRKTGAYRVYVQSHYNISLVMSLLNHSSQAMTLKYLGLDRESTEKKCLMILILVRSNLL